MASSKAGFRRRDFSGRVSRSRTTSDRDSVSIWATRASGNRTVNFFMAYISTFSLSFRPSRDSGEGRNPQPQAVVMDSGLAGFARAPE